MAFAACALFTGLVYWSIRHIQSITDTEHGTFAGVYAVAFVLLCWQSVLSYMERPYTTTRGEERALDKLNVVCSVPVYNEDPDFLRRCLQSLLDQSRRIDLIFVVDDGSKVDYQAVYDWFRFACRQKGIKLRWERQQNAGKRHAQGRVFSSTPDADIQFTVDSDTVLDRDGVRELLKPFKDPKVQSVAGLVLAANATKNVLSRFTDLWFVTGQLVDRSAMSTMGSVLVNSGPIAAYRADTIRENLHAYLNETFFGRRVEFSDDSMLTMYALAKGKAVQQPTAFAFSLMPETVNHHVRQQLRWMRGAFIRSWWRFKYLPVNSYAYWGHFIAWVQLVIGTFVFAVIFVYQPAVNPHVLPYLFIIPFAIGYGQALRYLTIRRSDMKFSQQFGIFLLSPVATLWSFTVLRVLRWYSIATCTRTGWGTRQEVELTA